jgi:hypothetical protein
MTLTQFSMGSIAILGLLAFASRALADDPVPGSVQADSAPQPASEVGKADAAARPESPADVKWRMDMLRSDLVAAALRGEPVTAAAGAKLESFFGLKPGAHGKLEAELAREAGAYAYEEIERALRLHPAELLKHVESAYEDDKVTNLEYEIVKAVKEQTEKRAAKARLKALAQEIRSGKR